MTEEEQKQKGRILFENGIVDSLEDTESFLKKLVTRFGNIILQGSITKFEEFLENNKVILKQKVEEGKIWPQKKKKSSSKKKTRSPKKLEN
jgi:hypothetical protein